MCTLLTAAKLAKRMGVAESTVRRWKRQEKIPYIQPDNGAVRFDFDAVIAATQTKRRKPKG